jgi:hypothetical protein
MHLKLKENPREWQKFALALAVMLGVLTWLANSRGRLPHGARLPFSIVIVAIPLLAWAFPRAFRPIYRGAMTASFHMGQVMGKVMLTLLFLLVLTPLGLLLRLSGKDLLGLRRKPDAKTYWHASKPAGKLDQMF